MGENLPAMAKANQCLVTHVPVTLALLLSLARTTFLSLRAKILLLPILYFDNQLNQKWLQTHRINQAIKSDNSSPLILIVTHLLKRLSSIKMRYTKSCNRPRKTSNTTQNRTNAADIAGGLEILRILATWIAIDLWCLWTFRPHWQRKTICTHLPPMLITVVLLSPIHDRPDVEADLQPHNTTRIRSSEAQRWRRRDSRAARPPCQDWKRIEVANGRTSIAASRWPCATTTE
jgi:hypothetical protein